MWGVGLCHIGIEGADISESNLLRGVDVAVECSGCCIRMVNTEVKEARGVCSLYLIVAESEFRNQCIL